MSDSVQPHRRQPTRLLCPWDSPGKNTGVSSHSLLQGILPTKGSNPGLPHCRWIPYLLSHQGSPRILEWVDYPFSRRSSQPRNQTGVSCLTGGFFTNWAIREAPEDIRNMDLIPQLGRSPRVGNSNPLQYSSLEKSMDRGAWRTTVHGVAKGQTWLTVHLPFSQGLPRWR